MCWTMWFMSVVALLMVDVRTGALQESDIKELECLSCGNGTSCEDVHRPTTRCPAGRLCATAVVVPGYILSLKCAESTGTPCLLRGLSNNSLELTCVCNSHLCNAPFSTELLTQLEKHLASPNNATNVTQNFFQTSTFANISVENLYNAITMKTVDTNPTKNLPQPVTTFLLPVTTTVVSKLVLKEFDKPRAEALKQEPTVPSDDDEDEGEGSGSDEESRVHNHAVSDPAAPNSLLPPEENKASNLFKHILLPLSIIYFVV